MYPTLLADTTSVCDPSGVLTTASALQGANSLGRLPCLRVIARGGFSFDAPLEALVEIPHRPTPIRVEDLKTGMPIYSPWDRTQINGPSRIPYDYEATDNRGKAHSYKGVEQVDPLKAELLGWLVGDGTITSQRQSIRFSSTDVWCLSRVQSLVEHSFPSVKISWYAKNAGFDITLTGGINNPLKHFIRRMDFHHGFPTAVSLFNREDLLCFLRGVWGAHGWVSTRKGGNDVDMGIRRSTNSAYSSMLRDLHASIGMRGQRRDTPTKANPDKHRLIFSGYANYKIFFDTIGQIADKQINPPPVRRARPHVILSQDSLGFNWYETPIQRILRIKDPQHCYGAPYGP